MCAGREEGGRDSCQVITIAKSNIVDSSLMVMMMMMMMMMSTKYTTT